VGNFGVATINDVEVIINQQLQAYVLRRDFNAEYLRYHVAASKAYFEQVGTSATLIYVNQKGFENLPVPCPSVEEQGDIVNFLNGEMSRLRSLELLAEDSIELLKERRSALIAAAVTGKIDVREKLSMLEAAA
jgi:type I restriction enzyme S subunit